MARAKRNDNGITQQSMPVPKAPDYWITQEEIADFYIGWCEDAEAMGFKAADVAEVAGISSSWLSTIRRKKGNPGPKTTRGAGMMLKKFGRAIEATNTRRPR